VNTNLPLRCDFIMTNEVRCAKTDLFEAFVLSDDGIQMAYQLCIGPPRPPFSINTGNGRVNVLKTGSDDAEWRTIVAQAATA